MSRFRRVSSRPAGVRRASALLVAVVGLAAALVVSPTGSAAAAACALPAQQQLDAALARMPGAKAVSFPIARYPALGTVTVEMFIRAREIWVKPGFDFSNTDMVLPLDNKPSLTALYDTWADTVPGLFLQGDGRDWNLSFAPEKTRAFAVLDFAAGTGYFVVNKSVSKLRMPVLPFPATYTAHKSWDARNTYRQWGGANNWFYADWISPTTYRLRTHIKESAFGTSWVAPAIDAQVTINKDTQQAVVSGDTFPTVAVHQPTSCRTLVVRPEVNPGDLYQYELPESISPGPVNATPAAPPAPPPAVGTNQPPVASFTYTRRAGAGNLVFFDGRASRDPDGLVSSWQWLSGGTVLGSGPTPTIALGPGSPRTVTLRVTDNRGAVASTSKTLYVGNRAPVIASVTPSGGATTGSTTPTLAAAARDDDGDALQFAYRVTGPSVDASSGWVGGAWSVPAHRLDPGVGYQWSVSVRDPSGAQVSRTSTFRVAMLPTAADVVATSTGGGYWQVASDGGVFSYGDAPFHGSVPGLGLRLTNIIGMARTPSSQGYWLVGRDGGVFAFGDAPFHGSLPGLGIRLDDPSSAWPPPGTASGYWLVGSDGGVFAFGDAGFFGSMGGRPLNAPIDGIAVTPTGQGYWLVAATAASSPSAMRRSTARWAGSAQRRR